MKFLISLKKNKKVLFDTFFYLLASLIPALLLIIINPLLAKNLSPEDYAIIGYIGSFATIVTPLVTFMLMRYYFVNYFRVDEVLRDRIKSAILHSLLLFSLVMSLLVVGGITIYHYRFNISSTIPLFPYLLLSVGAIWLGALFTFQLSEYRIQRLSQKFFWFSVSNGIIKLLLLLLLVVVLGHGAIGYELATFITAVIYFIYSFYKYRKCIFRSIEFSIIGDALKFCWPIALAGCLEFFSHGLGRVMLERLGDNVEYGYYSVGNQFATYISLVTTALFTAFNPDIYESAAKGSKKKLLKIFGILLSVETITVLLFILLAPYIISILTAGRYVMSIKYAQILAISQIFTLVFYYINDVTIAFGHTRIVMWTKLIVGVLSVIILLNIIERNAYVGAAWGQTLIYLLYSVVNLGLLVIMLKIKK